MDVLLTKATGEGFTSGERNGLREKAKREFEGGGWVMWPILLLALVGLGIIAERVVVFSRRDQAAERLSAEVRDLVAAGRAGEAADLCRRRGGAVGRVLLSVLEHAESPREYAESKAHEAMLHEAPALEKRITTMNILAAASPLVGLLGTVTGMVRLFDVITVHGTSNPKLMAGGISEALIATKWGLGIAIPLLLAYNLLDNWSVRIVSNMEKYAVRLINAVFPGVARRVEEHV
jgi:biopolymer transport protein ExbB